MEMFSVNADKCKGCGLCEAECGFNKAITVQDGIAHYDKSGNCTECLHCFKICPSGAIDYRGGDQATIFGPDEQISPVAARRSCRAYKQASINRELLVDAINKANDAPRFDISFHERKFIVVEDEDKLNGVRTILLNQISKIRKLFSVLAKNPFISEEKKKEYDGIILLFTNILEKSKSGDALFHGAPTLVIVTGQKRKTSAKENSLYAMSQFLIVAEELGIGTCINGFVSFFSRAVHKYLEIEKGYAIHGAAVAGYPKTTFTRHLVRNDTSVRWI